MAGSESRSKSSPRTEATAFGKGDHRGEPSAFVEPVVDAESFNYFGENQQQWHRTSGGKSKK